MIRQAAYRASPAVFILLSMMIQLLNRKLLLLVCFIKAGCITMAQCGVEYRPEMIAVQSKVYKVIKTNNNGYVVGFTISHNSLDYNGPSNNDICLMTFDSCGTKQWTKILSFGTLNSDGFNDMILTPDSGFMILGYAEGVIPGGIYSATLFKLDKYGNLQWKKVYGGENGLIGSQLSYNPISNRYIISGTMERKWDKLYSRPYIMQVDTQGNFVNERDIILFNDTNSTSNFKFAIPLSDGTIISTISFEAGGKNLLYLVKFTKELDTLWIRNSLIKDFEEAGIEPRYIFNDSTQKILGLVWGRKKLESSSSPFLIEFDSESDYTIRKNLSELIIGANPGLSLSQSLNKGFILGFPFTKLDNNFNIEWQKTFPENRPIKDIIQLANGSYVLLGFEWYVVFNGQDSVGYQRPYIQQTNTRGWLVNTPETKAINKPEVTVYPNPAQNTLTISGAVNATITITDIMGRVIDKSSLKTNTINIEHIPNGMYIVTITLADGKVFSQKVVVQH